MKDLKDVQLFDLYGALLTESRREMGEMYYLYDLSFSEIAEEKGVTKQAVSDCIKKLRDRLFFYEEKLGFAGLLKTLSARHPELGEEIEELSSSGRKEE